MSKREHNAIEQLLPEGYVPLEYIESTGTQYIDTLVTPNNSTGIKFKISNLVVLNNDFNFIGSRINGGDRFMVNYYDGIQVTYGFGPFGGFIGAYYDLTGNEQIEISLNYKNSKLFTIQEMTHQISETITSNLPYIYLFTQNISGAELNKTSYRLNGITEISQGDALIRCFTPALRLSDNKPGMYDLCGSICPLTGTPFYINAGTGEFLYN